MLGDPSIYVNPAVSPDGRRVAVSQTSQGNQDLWVLDASRGTSTRLTFDPARDDFPVWSPDGSRIVFASDRSGHFDLFQKASDGSGDDQSLLTSDEDKFPESWSRDSRYLLYTAVAPRTGRDLWLLPLEGSRRPVPFLRTDFYESRGQFSPDMHWVAYTSTESGIPETYVRPFSPDSGEQSSSSGGKWIISKGGGVQSRWRADGKQLFYLNFGGQVMAVDVTADKVFQAGVPRRLFNSEFTPEHLSTYGMTADGKRFLFAVPQSAGARTEPLTVVLNWQAGLGQ